jgi:hypothetical protein
MAGAARKAIRWFPTESASTKAMKTSRLSSCQRLCTVPRCSSTWSRQRKVNQVRRAMVKRLTV